MEGRAIGQRSLFLIFDFVTIFVTDTTDTIQKRAPPAAAPPPANTVYRIQ